MLGTLWSSIPPLTLTALSDRMRNSHREHRAIVERLLVRDADGAAATLEEPIRNAGGELARHEDESGKQQGPPGHGSRTWPRGLRGQAPAWSLAERGAARDLDRRQLRGGLG